MSLKPLSVIRTSRSPYREEVDLRVDLRVDAQLIRDVNTTLFTPEKQSEWLS